MIRRLLILLLAPTVYDLTVQACRLACCRAQLQASPDTITATIAALCAQHGGLE